MDTYTHLGFTGNRFGMTLRQMKEINSYMEICKSLGMSIAHHGDCIGADAEFHKLARIIGFKVYLHPPNNDSKRAFCDFDFIDKPLPYLERNQVIVDSCDVLVAAPDSYDEKLHSGTWSTIRKARTAKINTHIYYPDGSSTTEWYK